MPRYTSVYRDFISRTEEVHLLRKKAGALERSKYSHRHGDEINALCRGAIVLLSSHIEAYIKELGEHAIDKIYVKAVPRSKIAVQFFFHISRDKIESIRSTEHPDKIANHVFNFLNADGDLWNRHDQLTRPIPVEMFNSGFASPKFDKVRAYFWRFGYVDYKTDFYRKLGRDAHQIERNLNLIVATRNLIAHGDPSATKTPSEVGDMADLAKVFCRVTDDLFGGWCKGNICVIR